MTSRSFIVTRSTLSALTRYLEGQLVDGKVLRVTVGALPSKTTEQNAFLHLAIRELAQHVGMGETELKDLLKAEYGPETIRRVGNLCGVCKKSIADYKIELPSLLMVEWLWPSNTLN